MALRIELWESGRLVDGVEQWWDDVERDLDSADGDYPILTSVSPYGELRLATSRLPDLADECFRLAEGGGRSRALLLMIADLCRKATPEGELRFDGDWRAMAKQMLPTAQEWCELHLDECLNPGVCPRWTRSS